MKIILALAVVTAISFHAHERRPEWRDPIYSGREGVSEPYYVPAPENNGADSEFYRRYHEFDTPDDAR